MHYPWGFPVFGTPLDIFRRRAVVAGRHRLLLSVSNKNKTYKKS
jgi:hypothetical protein